MLRSFFSTITSERSLEQIWLADRSFVGEMLLGLWRAYSSLDPEITADGQTTLSMPRRLILPYAEEWDDYAGMNSFVVSSAFPEIAIGDLYDMTDLAESGNVYLFDRVVLGDRSAAGRGQIDANGQPWRVTSGAIEMPGSLYWWQPVRMAVFKAIGGQVKESRAVVTYINRQTWVGRMLRPSHHKALVKALETMCEEYDWEVGTR